MATPHHVRYKVNCAKCSKQIFGRFMIVEDYHLRCFTCEVCDGSLETGYYTFRGHFYCESCYKVERKKHAPICHTCRHPVISGVRVKASGNSYHKACFTCEQCKGELNDGDEFYKVKGKVYCEKCHWSPKLEASDKEKPNHSPIQSKEKEHNEKKHKETTMIKTKPRLRSKPKLSKFK